MIERIRQRCRFDAIVPELSTAKRKKPRFGSDRGNGTSCEAYCGVKFWCELSESMSWNSGVAGGRLAGFRNSTSK